MGQNRGRKWAGRNGKRSSSGRAPGGVRKQRGSGHERPCARKLPGAPPRSTHGRLDAQQLDRQKAQRTRCQTRVYNSARAPAVGTRGRRHHGAVRHHAAAGQACRARGNCGKVGHGKGCLGARRGRSGSADAAHADLGDSGGRRKRLPKKEQCEKKPEGFEDTALHHVCYSTTATCWLLQLAYRLSSLRYKRTPTTQAVINDEMVPPIMAVRPKRDKSWRRLGAMPPMPPI